MSYQNTNHHTHRNHQFQNHNTQYSHTRASNSPVRRKIRTAANNNQSSYQGNHQTTQSTNPDLIGKYTLIKTLGRGNFACVKLATHELTGSEVAIKVVSLKKLTKATREKLIREVKILKEVVHPNIVRLYEVIHTPTHTLLITEYCPNGDIHELLLKEDRMSEKKVRHLMRQLFSAIEYCHRNNIVHRDLKPENLLLDHNHNLKLADFGFVREFQPGNLLDTFCGSPPFAAPELLKGEKYHGPEVDIWAMGIIIYLLVCGKLPFDGKNVKELQLRVMKGLYDIPYFMTIPCEQLLKKMLVNDPVQRMTITEVMNHEWTNIGYQNEPLRPYRETTETLSDPHRIGLISALGFNPESIQQTLERKEFNNVMSTYLLLGDPKARARLTSRLYLKSAASSSSAASSQQELDPSHHQRRDSTMTIESIMDEGRGGAGQTIGQRLSLSKLGGSSSGDTAVSPRENNRFEKEWTYGKNDSGIGSDRYEYPTTNRKVTMTEPLPRRRFGAQRQNNGEDGGEDKGIVIVNLTKTDGRINGYQTNSRSQTAAIPTTSTNYSSRQITHQMRDDFSSPPQSPRQRRRNRQGQRRYLTQVINVPQESFQAHYRNQHDNNYQQSASRPDSRFHYYDQRTDTTDSSLPTNATPYSHLGHGGPYPYHTRHRNVSSAIDGRSRNQPIGSAGYRSALTSPRQDHHCHGREQVLTRPTVNRQHWLIMDNGGESRHYRQPSRGYNDNGSGGGGAYSSSPLSTSPRWDNGSGNRRLQTSAAYSNGAGGRSQSSDRHHYNYQPREHYRRQQEPPSSVETYVDPGGKTYYKSRKLVTVASPELVRRESIRSELGTYSDRIPFLLTTTTNGYHHHDTSRCPQRRQSASRQDETSQSTLRRATTNRRATITYADQSDLQTTKIAAFKDTAAVVWHLDVAKLSKAVEETLEESSIDDEIEFTVSSDRRLFQCTVTPSSSDVDEPDDQQAKTLFDIELVFNSCKGSGQFIPRCYMLEFVFQSGDRGRFERLKGRLRMSVHNKVAKDR